MTYTLNLNFEIIHCAHQHQNSLTQAVGVRERETNKASSNKTNLADSDNTSTQGHERRHKVDTNSNPTVSIVVGFRCSRPHSQLGGQLMAKLMRLPCSRTDNGQTCESVCELREHRRLSR